jgi:hypothetical protein
LSWGSPDAGPARTAAALNIITSASKTESLLFNVSLLHFRAMTRDTVASMKIMRVPQMGYYVFRSDVEDYKRRTLSRTSLARRSAEVAFHRLS